MPKTIHIPVRFPVLIGWRTFIRLSALALMLGAGSSLCAMLTVNFSVQQPACYGLPSGSVTATASGGVAPYTFLWSTGQTGPVISGITAGTYSVQVTSSNGLSTTASVTVGQPPLIVVDILVDDLCSPPYNLTASSTGGVPPYNYYWTGGITTQTLSNVPPGSYCVTVTDQNNCGALECITITHIPLNVGVTVNNVTCPGANNGSLTANPSGGVAPYTYLWSNGQSGQTISNLGPGVYSVTLTDSRGCTASATGTVTQPPPIAVALVPTQPTCAGFSNGSITANISGGTPPYTRLWSTGASTQSISNLPAGTYSLTVTDANGCPQSASITLAAQSNLNVGAVGTPQTCVGLNNGTATASVTGAVQPVSYAWSNGGNTQVISNLAPGSYTVTVTDGLGCQRTATAMVAAATPLVIQVTGTNVTTCGANNGTATVTIVSGTGPFTYQWSTGANTPTITNRASGTYSVTVTTAAGCVATGSVTITEPPAVFVNITGSNLVCAGASTGSLTANPTGGTSPFSYLWNTGAITQTISNLGAGFYAVTVTDANGCTATASRTINQAPAVNVTVSGSTVVCGIGATGSASAIVNSGTPPYNYLWSTGATTQNVSGLGAGVTSVTVTDANGCTATGSINITIVNNLAANVSGINPSCFGQSTGSATANPTGGNGPYTYVWSTGATTQSILNRPAGTYSVTVTDANGCTATGTITLSQPPLLTVNITANPGIVCFGAANGSLTANAAGGTPGYSYQWSNGATTQTISNLPAGTYSVTVTDQNECTATASFTIQQNPALNAEVQGNTVLCGAETGEATVTATGGTPPYAYNWSTGAQTESIESLSGGTYSVTVTDARGCTDVAEITITIVSDFMVNLVPRSVLCFGGNTGSVLAVPAGGTPPYTYQWSNGAGNVNEIINLMAGVYSVTVTEGSGCTFNGTVTVTQPPLLGATAVGQNANCFGAATGSATVMPTGGTPPYTYQWSNSQTTATINNLTAGVYTVTVTDANLCTVTRTVTITQPGDITATVTAPTITCGGATGSATVTPLGGTPPYTYLWSNGATTQTAPNLTAGVYSVTITDANGCQEIVSTITLNQLPVIQPTLTVTNINCSNAAIGAINTTVTGGTPPYSYQWNTGATTANLSNLAAGTYILTVRDANNCTATVSATVQQTPGLTVTANRTNVNCFGGANGTATAVVGGGTPPYSYAWSNGGATATITNLTAGVYTVTVTDANECTGTAQVSITQPTQLNASITGSVNPGCFGGSNGSATVTATGGTPPYSYLWSNGATTATASGLAAGAYTVVVTDANGCTANANVNLSQPTDLLLSVSMNNGTCLGSSTGILSANASGGTPPYSYAWSNGGTTQAISNLAPGVYNLTVTDSRGCTETATAAVTAFPAPTCQATVLQQAYNGNDGIITVAPAGGTPPYTYLWSNGATTQTISNLPSNTYTVTVTDANGCQTTCSNFVFGPSHVTGFVWLDNDQDGLQDPGEPGIPNIMVIITGTQEMDPPFSDTTFTNAQGNYSFDLVPGTYKITFVIPTDVYDPTIPNAGNDAIDSDMDPVTFMTEIFTLAKGQDADYDAGVTLECVNITDAGEICCNQFLCGPGNDPAPINNVELPSGGIGAIEYVWMYTTTSPGLDIQFWNPVPNSNSPSYDPGPLYQTTYFTRCARRDGCTLYLESNIITIEVGSVAVADPQGPSPVCVNEVVTYFAAGALPGAQIQWNFGPAAQPPTANGTPANVRFLSTGIFNIQLRVTQGGCTSTAYKQVAVVNNPTVCDDNFQIDVDVMDNEQGQIMVQWNMPADAVPLSYVVERSDNGQDFEDVGAISQPSFTQAGTHHFEFVDYSRKRGRNFYRVVARDNQNNALTSEVEEVVLYNESRLALLYPNPANDNVTLEIFETFDEEVTLELTAATGVVLHRQQIAPGASTHRLDLSQYPAGAYFVRLKFGETSVKTLKVLRR